MCACRDEGTLVVVPESIRRSTEHIIGGGPVRQRKYPNLARTLHTTNHGRHRHEEADMIAQAFKPHSKTRDALARDAWLKMTHACRKMTHQKTPSPYLAASRARVR